MAKDKAKWVQIGEVGVDAGMLMISDPCYVIGDEPLCDDCDKRIEPSTAMGKAFSSWGYFIEEQKEGGKDWQLRHQLDYAHGAPGLGVVAGTAHGDGLFKVYALKNDESDRTQALLVITGDMDPPV